VAARDSSRVAARGSRCKQHITTTWAGEGAGGGRLLPPPAGFAGATGACSLTRGEVATTKSTLKVLQRGCHRGGGKGKEEGGDTRHGVWRRGGGEEKGGASQL